MQPQQQQTVGLPMPSFNIQKGQRQPDSLAKSRGKDWALPDASHSSVPVSRPVVIECRGDRLVILSDDGKSISKEIPLAAKTGDSVDELRTAVWAHMKNWGAAGKGLYWKPTLSVRVAPDGRAVRRVASPVGRQRPGSAREHAHGRAASASQETLVEITNMARHDAVETESGGNVPLVGVVTSIAGILLVLVTVVADRAWQSASLLANENVDLAATRQAAQSLEAEVNRLAAETNTVHAEAAVRRMERDRLATMLAAADAELAARRGGLDAEGRKQFDLERDLAQARANLEQLEKQRKEAADTPSKTVKVESFPTPLSRPVDSKEVHFQLKNGHLAYVPMNEFLAQVSELVREKQWKLKDSGEFTDTFGPVDGFTVRFTVVREEIPWEEAVHSGHGGATIALDHAEFLPSTSQLGEPIQEALTSKSAFRGRLDDLNPKRHDGHRLGLSGQFRRLPLHPQTALRSRIHRRRPATRGRHEHRRLAARQQVGRRVKMPATHAACVTATIPVSSAGAMRSSSSSVIDKGGTITSTLPKGRASTPCPRAQRQTSIPAFRTTDRALASPGRAPTRCRQACRTDARRPHAAARQSAAGARPGGRSWGAAG